MKQELATVLFTHAIDNLPQTTWTQLQQIHAFLQVFAEYTDRLSKEVATTISEVLPALLVLSRHIESTIRLIGADEFMRNAILDLRNDFQSRFSKFLLPNDVFFEPIYCVATYLELRYRKLLDLHGGKLRVAAESERRRILDLSHLSYDNMSISVNAGESGNYLKDLFAMTETVPQSSDSSQSVFERELSRFLLLLQLDRKSCPLKYWLSLSESDFPLMRAYALDVLCIPASSASVERAFSAAGKSKSGDRNSLSPLNLEREILIRCNAKFLNILAK